MQNLKILSNQFLSQQSSVQISEKTVNIGGSEFPHIVDYHPHKKIKFNVNHQLAWGFKDTQFAVNKEKKAVYLTGNRYPFSGKMLPNFPEYAVNTVGIDPLTEDPRPEKTEFDIPESRISAEFVRELGEHSFSRRSFDPMERYMHSHGESIQEMVFKRFLSLKKVCDMVIYPDTNAQVEKLVALANKHNIVLVPYGGGTNVAFYLLLDEKEQRPIVSVDMTRMDRIKYVDKENLLVCAEAGCIGLDLENELLAQGFTLGHEPDSWEFSTVGGWVSTRASGMKKNVYGNFEELLQNAKIVTSVGTFSRSAEWPRITNGADFNQILMGSEGNFGIITEVVIKIRPKPEQKRYGSILFPNFENGIKFMHELALSKIWPASCRVVDEVQFQTSYALKTANDSVFQDWIDSAKKFYLFNIKKFDPAKMCACTLFFEGSKVDVDRQMENTYRIAEKHGGLNTGEEHGLRGYMMTFCIAYLRDFHTPYGFYAESVETSCAWTQVSPLCRNVKKRIYEYGMSLGLEEKMIWCGWRVTQLYASGAALYLYYGFNGKRLGAEESIKTLNKIELEIRKEIIRNGGSVSHHHGVGKRKKHIFYSVYPKFLLNAMVNFKKELDPNNVFAINNTYYFNPEEEREEMEAFGKIEGLKQITNNQI